MPAFTMLNIKEMTTDANRGFGRFFNKRETIVDNSHLQIYLSSKKVS